MSIHEYRPVRDNRKRVEKDYPTGVLRIPFPAMHIHQPLGLWLRTFFWYDLDAHLDQSGGHACGWTRKFAEQHITPSVCGGLVDRRFPNFVALGDAWLREQCFALKGRRELGRSETVSSKCYRYAWGGYHDQNQEDPKLRFGPGKGPRYWKNNPLLSNHMYTVRNAVQKHGPNIWFEYDILRPELPPVLRVGAPVTVVEPASNEQQPSDPVPGSRYAP